MTRVSYRYRYQEQNEQILQIRRHIMADTKNKMNKYYRQGGILWLIP
jgi:hypothetical protein